MIDFDYNFLLVSIWALIGSVIGFYVIRYKPQWSTETCIKQLIISVSVGIFFAIPSYVIFVEKYALSERLSILLAGSTAFCITDLIITLWFKLKDTVANGIIALVNSILNKLSNRGK